MRIQGAIVSIGMAVACIVSEAASAATIDILQVNNHLDGGNPAAPAGFTLLDLGTGTPNSLQTTLPFTVGGVTFSFGGGSGEYAGNSGSSSPFGASNATKNFVQAGGGGGTVDVTWATTQNELYVLWGTVDPEFGRNVITIGATTISGADIVAAIMSEGFSYYDHQSNTYLKIAG